MRKRDPGAVLVVAPHADDEVLGAGGLMAKLAARGHEVHVAYVAVGGFRSLVSSVRTETSERIAELEQACATLRVRGYTVLSTEEDYHLQLDTRPQRELIGYIEREIERVRPWLVLIPHWDHYNQDHHATSKACRAALRPGAPHTRMISDVLSYGTNHQWWSGGTGQFDADTFVDIADTLELKLTAMRCYASQMHGYPHPRSIEAILAYASSWGAFVGTSYAEPYVCVRRMVVL